MKRLILILACLCLLGGFGLAASGGKGGANDDKGACTNKPEFFGEICENNSETPPPPSDSP